MQGNPVVAALGRRLRLGLIGGGPGSFIGEIHRTAARLDDRYQLVAAALSSDPGRAVANGRAMGLPDDRAYPGGPALIAGEAARSDDGADVIAVMTPNDTHYEYSVAALDAGFDVICDKPICNDLAEAIDLVHRVRRSGQVFCLTHNYSGYPLVRQARAMVANGALGDIRMAQVEYVQGGNAALKPTELGSNRPWRMDAAKSGPSLVMGDIGTHAHQLIEFVTGLRVAKISADIGTVVPDRQVDDVGGALLRFDSGARGVFWVTQAAAGVENSIAYRVSGATGSLEWNQQHPQVLNFRPIDAPAQVLTPNGLGALPENVRACRVRKGHPEGFPEAFANLYSDAAEAIAARRAGTEPDPLALSFPSAEDGARGLKFVMAAKASSAADGAWTDCSLDL